ncbi:MAG: amino acid ABC transporter substrate-binding protein [Proteobacteria bacterium]|nr:amino acid ABC transporter substrate-binding protein [Pseudomonadota bacterium]
MREFHRVAGVFLAWAVAALSLPAASAAGATLDTVKQRGELVCGVNGALPGFSFFNAVKEWEGLDVDLCRAVAAAVLGSATKVKFVPLEPKQRFDALRSGAIDMLAANATLTLQRETAELQFAVANYYDGQAFVVAKKLEIKNLTSLRGGSVCTVKGTTHEANMEAWFRERHLLVTPVRFDNQDAMYDAFLAGRCTAVTQDATALAASIVRRGKAADYMMLPEVISKEPLGPYVRRGDEAWLDVVRWTQYAMIEAEELDLTRENVDRQFTQSSDPAVRRLLGLTPGNGKALGLDEKWAYNVIGQVGNYGESYERNLGMRSPLRLARGINALWTKGGLMYALPLR